MKRTTARNLMIFLIIAPFIFAILNVFFHIQIMEIIILDLIALMVVGVIYISSQSKKSYGKRRMVRGYEISNTNQEEIDELIKKFLKDHNFILTDYRYGEKVYLLDDGSKFSKKYITYNFYEKFLVLEYWLVIVGTSYAHYETSTEERGAFFFGSHSVLLKTVDELESKLNIIVK